MKISLITPAKKQSRNGNRTTAVRWARILRALGHEVKIDVDYGGEQANMMIALHAWRSAESIVKFKNLCPTRPLILALTGTDINEFIHSHPKPTLHSMNAADELVCLHDGVAEIVAKKYRNKLHVIYQSATPLPGPRKPAIQNFDICVLGHLRDVKDPLRTALAVRNLPAESRIRVIHLGKAHNKIWANRAVTEMNRNPRYIWKGERPGWQVRRELAKTRLMVISSLAEGGANVVSEALVTGVPVIASNIHGNLGMLGPDYPGYYPVGDEDALRDLLRRAEQNPEFLADLTRRCKARAKLFKPAEERRRWRTLMAKYN
ncbi:MAG: TIGR04348 family glycosyltransferase [Rhodospirillaceae bacterium]|nr:TIGR04348 family glycosyltransferase [Rhodospirillaceae bacterium]MDP6927000.1 selenoneine biosynthesis selenosugar synthase SenB [Rhodospirillales bacterium]